MAGDYTDWHGTHARAVAGHDEGRSEYINDVSRALTEIAKEDVARLPEDQFREIFLPLFTKFFGKLLRLSDEEKRAPLPHQVGIADWISIAGTPYKEVDVFDPKTGEVLFRCPALFDYHGINPVRGAADRANMPIAEIAAMAEKLRLVHPRQSETYLVRELSKRSLFVNSGAKLAETVMRWNEVFKRYGKHLAIPGATVNTSATASSSVGQAQQAASPSMEADYEDF
jgi:hypothetical protein